MADTGECAAFVPCHGEGFCDGAPVVGGVDPVRIPASLLYAPTNLGLGLPRRGDRAFALEEDVGPVAPPEDRSDFGGRDGGAGTIGDFGPLKMRCVRPPPPLGRPPGLGRWLSGWPACAVRGTPAASLHRTLRFCFCGCSHAKGGLQRSFRLASRSLGRLPDDLLHFPRERPPLGLGPSERVPPAEVPVRDAARPARRLPRRHGAEVPDRRLDVGALRRGRAHRRNSGRGQLTAESSAERCSRREHAATAGAQRRPPRGVVAKDARRRPVQTAQAFHESRRGCEHVLSDLFLIGLNAPKENRLFLGCVAGHPPGRFPSVLVLIRNEM